MNSLPADLILRRMVLDDLPQVYRIELDSFTLPWPFSSYVYELTSSQVSRCYVAATTDATGHKKVLGMIVVYIIEDEGHVATFAIHPEYRRAGIGWRLLHHAFCESLKEGITHAFLEVRAGNSTAIRLYEKFGFEVVNVRKKYYVDNNEDALLMNLDNLTLSKLNDIKSSFLREPSQRPTGGNHDT